MLINLINRPCTITQRTWDGTADRYGSSTPQTATTDTVCELQERPQAAANERDNIGEIVESRWLLILPAGTAIGAADSVEVEDAGVFEVHGEPWVARNPRTQVVSHIEATVRRAGGIDPDGDDA